jgi:hypothetical protein
LYDFLWYDNIARSNFRSAMSKKDYNPFLFNRTKKSGNLIIATNSLEAASNFKYAYSLHEKMQFDMILLK